MILQVTGNVSKKTRKTWKISANPPFEALLKEARIGWFPVGV